MSPRLAYTFAVGLILIGALLLRVWDPDQVARLRLLVFDTYQQIQPRPHDETLPVRIIDIDDESLKRHGQWPWPRTLLAEMVEKLRQNGAGAVGFDIVFPEPDRLSLEQFADGTPHKAFIRDLIESRKDAFKPHDLAFAESLATMPTILGFIATSGRTGAAPAPKSGIAFAGDDPKLFVPRYGGSAASLPELQKSAVGAGALNWIPEYDQVVRRLPMLVAINDTLYPALAIEALRVAQGASTLVVRSSGASGDHAFGAQTGVSQIRAGDFALPTDAQGRMWLWFTPSRRDRYIPAWQLIAGEAPKEQIEGHIVLIGTSAAGLFDLRATPLEAAIPGVELHAQAIEQIIQQRFLERPDFMLAAELAYILILGLLIAGLVYGLGALGAAIVTLLAVGGVGALSWYAFDTWGWLVDPVYPTFALALVYLTGTVIVYLRTEGERNRVRHAFGHYMAPALVERLAAEPGRLKLGGEMREMTLLFSDIRGFTAISEGLSAEQLTHFINSLMTPLSNIILEEKGTIDKYMGDAVMAFWNAPLDDPEHGRNACRAALRMVERMKTLNEEWQAQAEVEKRKFKPVVIGLGLNTGECCVGNLGSDRRFDYSVIGDNVNVASRFEGQTKVYGVPIVVGEATAAMAPDYAFLELDLLTVKGKSEPVRAFALLGDESVARLSTFADLKVLHLDMLSHMRKRSWAAAEELIAECERAEGFGLQRLYESYRKRIGDYRRRRLPKNWDGSVEAETK